MRIPQDVQRPQPPVAARPGLDAAGPHAGLHAAAAASRRRAARPAAARRRGRRDARSPGCARELRAHPCHGCSDREDHARWAERYHKLDRDTRDPAAPDRAAHQHDRPPVRPGLRGADRARATSRTTRSPTTGARLMRIYTDMDLVAAECLRARAVGRAVARASWPRRCPRWSSRPGAPTTPRAPRLPGGPGQAGARRHGLAVGRPRRPGARAQARLPARARPRASPGRPTAGPRAPASTRCSTRPTWPPATSCAG